MEVSLESIKQARKTIGASVVHTPLVEVPALADSSGGKVFLKLENLQKTGSFKLRGALNKIASLTEAEKKCGVIASSAGNHAQGVALGSTAQGIKSVIVMPETAPLSKVAATKGYGAEVVLCGSVYDDAYAKACELQKEKGYTFLHPYNDEYVISGQGTIGLEILEDNPDIDAVLVPVGGGGILAGIACAVKSLKPSIKVIGVEAANAPSMRAAFDNKKPVDVQSSGTIADGINVKLVGDKTYALAAKYVDDIVTVTDDEIATSIMFLLEKGKVVAEGAGATPLAAVLAGKIDCKGKKVCAVVSGGNVDINMVDRIINRASFIAGRRCEIRVKLQDKAGETEKLLHVIASERANVLFVTQTMYNRNLGATSQEMTLILECTDEAHAEAVRAALVKSGYELR